MATDWKLWLLICSLFTPGCGYEARDSEVSGQVKKVVRETPLICPNRNNVDLSLGIIRGGVGSVSNQDMWFYIPDAENFELLSRAAENGSLVKITYDTARFVICHSDHIVTKAELIK